MSKHTKHTVSNKIFKFISSPGLFLGTKGNENPMVWLYKVKRLWMRGNFSDEEVLLIAASNLTGQAKLWWVPLEDSIVTWDAFEEAFKAANLNYNNFFRFIIFIN